MRLVDLKTGESLATSVTYRLMGDYARSDGRLIVAEWTWSSGRSSGEGIRVTCLDGRTLQRQYSVDLLGASNEGGMSVHHESIRIEPLGGRLVVLATSAAAVSMELLDPATGAILARQVLAR